jgi:hypothetical protein
MVNTNVAKAGGLKSQEEPLCKIKLDASSRNAGASEGKVVVLYFEPSATQNLKSSGFPRCFKGKQHGKIDPILRIHQWRYPIIYRFTMILAIIADLYLIFAMLFMQLRGKHPQWITNPFWITSFATADLAITLSSHRGKGRKG